MESISDGVRARIALEKHGFRFQHTLGQNFLLDDERVARIVALSGVNEADDVLEIGPGAGVLTCALARRARRVVALEIDRALAPVLTEMLSGVSNVRLEFADALKVDLAALMGGRFAVVANLPYYITADMVMKLLKSGLDISHITIMVQKEAAARMMARVGEAQYCLLAATIAYCARCESLMDVPPGAFTPPPHVESRLLQITPYEKKPVQPRDEALFLRVLAAAFAMRRKTLANNLSRAFQAPREQILAWLEAAGIDPMARGEAVELAALARLSDAMRAKQTEGVETSQG